MGQSLHTVHITYYYVKLDLLYHTILLLSATSHTLSTVVIKGESQPGYIEAALTRVR